MGKPDFLDPLIKALEKQYGADDWGAIPSLLIKDLLGNVGRPPDPEVTKRRAIVFQKMVELTIKGEMTDRTAAKEVAKVSGIKSALDDWKVLKRGLKNPDPDKIDDKGFDRVTEYLAIQQREKMQGSSLKELAMLCFGSNDRPTQEKVRPLYNRLRQEA